MSRIHPCCIIALPNVSRPPLSLQYQACSEEGNGPQPLITCNSTSLRTFSDEEVSFKERPTRSVSTATKPLRYGVPARLGWFTLPEPPSSTRSGGWTKLEVAPLFLKRLLGLICVRKLRNMAEVGTLISMSNRIAVNRIAAARRAYVAMAVLFNFLGEPVSEFRP